VLCIAGRGGIFIDPSSRLFVLKVTRDEIASFGRDQFSVKNKNWPETHQIKMMQIVELYP
jgi:hypothetical protein